jgi:hypothetical protein
MKQKYIETCILISPNWDVEFHIHIDVSLLLVGVMLTLNLTRKLYQPIVYASRLLNSAKRIYSTTKGEAIVMVFAFHKFRHYLLCNDFVFYVNHMALVYLLNKP